MMLRQTSSMLLLRNVVTRSTLTTRINASSSISLVRTFASSRDNFLKILKDEIKHGSEEADKAKELGKQSSPFKLVSESKSGEIVLGRDADGYKLKVLFDAKEFSYEYPEDEPAISTLPIKIEITPVDSDLSIMVSGEVEQQSVEEGQENSEDADDGTPYFTPTSVKTGKPGSITDDDFAPDIDELDEDLQDCFAEWLSDFQIDQDLFQLVLDHAERKETNMYLEWLKDVKKVVEGVKKQ
jgi:hypothetical protein